MIEAIDHLYVETPSFEAACVFWQGLGFAIVDQWQDDDHRACRLEAGNTYIVLAEAATASFTVHFRVSDLERHARQVENNESVVVQLPLEATHWGSQWMRLQDPDGQVFVLEEPDGDG